MVPLDDSPQVQILPSRQFPKHKIQMSPQKLIEFKLAHPWGEHPQYPRFDWKLSVGNDDTQLGYWDWVDHRIEFDADGFN